MKKLAAMMLCAAASVFATEPSAVQVLLDESQALTLDQVQKMDFTPAAGANFGYTDAAVWLRTEVVAEESGVRWAVVHYPRIPQLDFYAVYADRRVEHHRSGTEVSMHERTVSVREHVFPFQVRKDEPVVLYFRAVSPVSIQLPVRIWTPEAYVEQMIRKELLSGFLMAYMLALALAGLILAVTLRVRAAAIQAVAIFTHVLIIYCFTGYAGWLGFPKGSFFNFSGIPFLAQVSMIVSLIYFCDVMDFKNRWSGVFPFFRLFISAECVLVLTLAFRQDVFLIQIHLWTLIVGYMLMLITSAISACQRFRPAYYFLAGWLVLIVILSAQQLHYLGVVEAPWALSITLLQGLACIGSTFFVFAVADRVRMVRQQRDSARNALLEQTRSEARRLRQMVDERTAELTLAKENAEAANEQKTWFIANVSHDLRAPISSLISLANIFRHHSSELKLPERFNRFLAQLHSGGEFLMLMLNNILDLSALEMNAAAVRPERFELKTWCCSMTDLARSLAEARGVQVECECSGGEIETDRTRLSQILLNLAQNAVKFSPEKGTVRIELNLDGGALLLKICDEGPGIAPEERRRIFDLFAQGTAGPSHRSGVGLGLNIVQRNVALLGGSISVGSAESGGSCFSVRIPLSGA